jgi:protein phosphatase inhibitor 2
VSPSKEKDLSEKELTIINTHTNAGHRRSSSSASRPAGTRRRSSRTSSQCTDDEGTVGQRLQWDEANLYLTEQERTATMKITEPKTPYARHYEPSEDDDDDMIDGDPLSREDIPGLSLGEPEEEVPEGEFATSRKQSKVHVNDEDATPLHDAENDYIGMTPEEREKHRKFEELRKKHYEMRNVAKFLGHPEELDEMEEDMPTIDGSKVRADD